MYSLFRFDLFPQSPLDAVNGAVIEPLQSWRFTTAPWAVQAPSFPIPALSSSGDVVTPPGGHSNVEWVPELISSAPPTMSREASSNELRIEVPLSNPVAQLFRAGPPNGSLWVSIYLVTESLPGPLSIFIGRVRACAFNEESAALTVLALEDVLGRVGCAQRMTRHCNWQLYSAGTCGVTPGGGSTKHHAIGTIKSVSDGGLTLTLNPDWTTPGGSQPASETFNGGFVVIEPLNYEEASSPTATVLGFGGQKRSIMTQEGDVLTLATPVFGVNAGDKVILYRGCNGSGETCRNVFDNYKRFGGFEFTPSKDPFVDGATG